MNQYAIISFDNVCRWIIKANDTISALEIFEKLENNKSVTDGAVAILYKDYKKQLKTTKHL